MSALLQNVEFELLQGTLDAEVENIVYNSKKANKGSLFVCIEGAEYDGHDFAKEAIARGSVAVICSKPLSFKEEITVVRVDDSRRELANLAAAFCQYPTKGLFLIGVTGTKGKTSTTYMMKSIFEHAKIKTGLIGTVEIDTGKNVLKSHQTTPGSLELHQYFREMVDAGCQAVVMEVSSQALKLERVHGICFDVAVLTNIEEDHIGPYEHQDFSEYLFCKSKLFGQCKTAIVNGDDPSSKKVLQYSSNLRKKTYGFKTDADLYAENLDYVRLPGKFAVEFQTKGRYNINLVVAAAGAFSAYNAMAAVLAAKELDVSDRDIQAGLKDLVIPGRQELFSIGYDKSVMVDYAHNGMALTSLLQELRRYQPTRLTCVFGCGGERDRNRRFNMGEAAAKYADFSVITSDNPRNESPTSIINDIIIKMRIFNGAYCVIEDRRKAIDFAIRHCIPGEIVVIAGKGHEDYQIIGKRKIHFDDREEVRASIEKVNNEQNYN